MELASSDRDQTAQWCFGVYQIACKDPDGCDVELNFQNV
jgi:hypothetical protein